jgi:adhesin HecA-like repeat protein
MADTVGSVILENGPRRFVIKLTNFSDGTGESNVTKVTAANLGASTANGFANAKIRKVEYAVPTGLVQLQWKASTNTDALILAGTHTMDFCDTQGILNDAGTGITGDLTLTTQGFKAVATAASGYTIVLYFVKGLGA